MKIIVFLIILVISDCYCITSEVDDEFKIVQTDKGFVRGKKLFTLIENKPYYAFKGIPYGKPPLKELRFKSTEPHDPWNNIHDAFEFGNECLQAHQTLKFFPSTSFIFGDEDCLFLNVYAPVNATNLPVMLFFHGGGYMEGSGNAYGPDFIINENTILVTMNFRLGPLGFMSLGTPDYSGNMGMKDQLFVLKWINRNIENFGGNSNQVTIVGQSVGAVFVQYFTVSEYSGNLFHRAIIMSGSALNLWSINEQMDNLNQMMEFAKTINSSVTNINELIIFLHEIDAKFLIEKNLNVKGNLLGGSRKNIFGVIWAPVLEGHSTKDPILTELVSKSINNENFQSSIDTMFGYTIKEVANTFWPELLDPSLLIPFNQVREVQLPLNFDSSIDFNSTEYKEISKAIHDIYFGESVDIDKNSLLQYIDLLSDLIVVYGMDLSVKTQAKKSTGRTFYYQFSIDDQLNVVKQLTKIKMPGAIHSDDLCYLFRCNIPNLYDNIQVNSRTWQLIKTFVKLWTNFAKYGDPTLIESSVIHPVSKNDIHFFNITNVGVVTGRDPRGKFMKFWNNVYIDHQKFLENNILNY